MPHPINLESAKSVDKLPTYRSILLAADASDHSNRGASEAALIGQLHQAKVTGAHVYAAALHDRRFRQMEGGLPERYKEEEALEKQRDVHDTLITKGLSTITDSYLDEVENTCNKMGLEYQRCSLEGKNYRELVKETNSGRYDLLVMGSLGLGAVPTSGIGTVCERVCRRSNIDTLVIKEPNRSIAEGPVMVAIDGSSQAYGGLLTGLALAQAWQVPVEVVSAFDPYYHYVAFNRIANVLSEEAGKVFRFKEQEQLHEDIIDAGLAKIYQGHLDIALEIANEHNIKINTTLLDGKPYEIIGKQLKEINPSLLIMGKLGIHADDELDIGGNAENLLRNAQCAVLLGQREYTPQADLLAQTTTSWTVQAEKRLLHVPEFARSMARLGILRYAQERGHTVITENMVAEATANLCPVKHPSDPGDSQLSPEQPPAQQSSFRPPWSQEALAIVNKIGDDTVRENLKMRTEKKTRQEQAEEVQAQHVLPLMPENDQTAGHEGTSKGKCPFGHSKPANNSTDMLWDDDAQLHLEKVPPGFVQEMTRQRVEHYARAQQLETVTLEAMLTKYNEWEQASVQQHITLSWDNAALERVNRIPTMVRGMVIKEVERCAQNKGLTQVSSDLISEAAGGWEQTGQFHSENNSKLATDKPSALTNDLYLLAINLTRRCNLACAHCYLDATTLEQGDSDELTTEEVCLALDEVAARSDETMVVLTGGEPLLRQDLEQIVTHGAEKGLSMVAGTNGTLLTEKRAEALKQAGLLGAGISIDSLKADVHDAFRGQPGSWQRTMLGIENCKNAGLDFQVHFTVTDSNVDELDDMIVFCREKGARVLSVFFLICTGRGDTLTDISAERYEAVIQHLINAQADNPDLIIRPRCAPHFKRIAHQLQPEAAMNRISGQEGDGCIAAIHYARINHQGNVTPCPYIEDSAGSIRQQSFMSIWEDAPLFKQLREPELAGKCGICEYRELCGGCRARPRALGNTLMDEDPWCHYEPQDTDVIQPWRNEKTTVTWTPEAEQRVNRIPGFIRKMVRKRVEAFVEELGEEQITTEHLDQMTARRFGNNKPKRPHFHRH